MADILIDQLFNSKKCGAIRELYEGEPSSRESIKNAISSTVITATEKIIVSHPIDVLYIICSAARFADSEDECLRIANMIYQYRKNTSHLLPSIIDDVGLKFASKTLISLSLYPQALERRQKYHGAPSPAFYRGISKSIFKANRQEDISSHHEQWEHFLAEVLI